VISFPRIVSLRQIYGPRVILFEEDRNATHMAFSRPNRTRDRQQNTLAWLLVRSLSFGACNCELTGQLYIVEMLNSLQNRYSFFFTGSESAAMGLPPHVQCHILVIGPRSALFCFEQYSQALFAKVARAAEYGDLPILASRL
jgi:hypothetical protein